MATCPKNHEVVSFVGRSGSGKTTLLENVIPELDLDVTVLDLESPVVVAEFLLSRLLPGAATSTTEVTETEARKRRQRK